MKMAQPNRKKQSLLEVLLFSLTNLIVEIGSIKGRVNYPAFLFQDEFNSTYRCPFLFIFVSDNRSLCFDSCYDHSTPESAMIIDNY